jgi:hypothetical protein
MRIYRELAPWFHLLTNPSEYEQEAAFAARAIETAADGEVSTLLDACSTPADSSCSRSGSTIRMPVSTRSSWRAGLPDAQEQP